MKNKIILLLLTSSLFYAGCASTGTIEDNSKSKSFLTLQDKIQNIFNDSMFTNAHWGALIKSLKTGEVWYKQNSEKLFNPASNEKIPTAATALTKLGADFRFKTNISYNGVLTDSSINGDLIVWSNGDPTLYSRFYDDPCVVFRQWADTLKENGDKKHNRKYHW